MTHQLKTSDASTALIRTLPLVPGEERNLVHAVLRESLDFAYLPECEPESAQRFERLGLPALSPDAYLLWCRNSATETSQHSDEQWAPHAGIWIDAATDSIRSLLRTTEVALPHSPESIYLRHGTDSSHAHLMLQPATASGEVTTAEVGPEQARAIALKASHSLNSVWVPCSQEAVNACLAEAGFIPRKTRRGLLLNPLLSRSQIPSFATAFKLSNEDVARYGQDSGDLNPLHFDDVFARLHGFKGRISHGMLFNAWVTRYLGMQYPGPGTIFLKQSSSYFAPIYPNQEYIATVTVPLLDERRGVMRVLVQLRQQEDGAVAQLSYNDVMQRQLAA